MDDGAQRLRSLFVVLNQLYEMEQKLKRSGDAANLSRNVGKMKDAFADLGLAYDAHISVAVKTESRDLAGVLSAFEDKIAGEVLADTFIVNADSAVDGKQIEIDDLPATVSVIGQ